MQHSGVMGVDEARQIVEYVQKYALKSALKELVGIGLGVGLRESCNRWRLGRGFVKLSG